MCNFRFFGVGDLAQSKTIKMPSTLSKLADKDYRKDKLNSLWMICKDWCLWLEDGEELVDIGHIYAINSATKFKHRGVHIPVLKIQYTDRDTDFPSNEGIIVRLSCLSKLHLQLNKNVKAICVQELPPAKEASELYTYTKSVCVKHVLITIIFYCRCLKIQIQCVCQGRVK